jgi:glycosyltransferase involved in cell wall biosynthesis
VTGDAPLRLVMAAPPPTRGPIPRIAELLAAGLRSAGCEVTTLAWGGRGASISARAFEVAADVRRIRRTVIAAGPDLVLVHTSHDSRALARDIPLALSLRSSAARLVLQLHGSRADLLERPGSPLLKRATSFLLERADGVLLLSTEEKRAFERFAPGVSFHVVANPYVPPPPAVPATARERDVPVILFAARLLPEKGVLDTVEALAVLRRRVEARLVIAGDGPASAEVRQLVAERGLSDHVDVVGHLSAERLVEAFHAADVFALPTYHPEGFPTAVSDAMSAGLPIVTTRVRGNADHLLEGTNALFVPPRDPAALAGALERVLTEGDLRRRMSSANLEKVAEFAPERVVPAYVHALREILERPHRG